MTSTSETIRKHIQDFIDYDKHEGFNLLWLRTKQYYIA